MMEFMYKEVKMGAFFGSTPRVQPQVQDVAPVIIDNSEQTQKLEQARKKRRGAAMQMIAGNTSLSGNNIRKTSLGE